MLGRTGRSQEGAERREAMGKAHSRSGKPGAPGTIRTCDLCLRRAALYPLSYGRGESQCSGVPSGGLSYEAGSSAPTMPLVLVEPADEVELAALRERDVGLGLVTGLDFLVDALLGHREGVGRCCPRS